LQSDENFVFSVEVKKVRGKGIGRGILQGSQNAIDIVGGGIGADGLAIETGT